MGRLRAGAALAGSFAPDVPLFMLTGWYLLMARSPGGPWFGEAYDQYFFDDPLWIIAHNFLHAPLILAALFALGYVRRLRDGGAGRALWWFSGAAAGHTLIDVFTHRHDGPLLLFPFDWSFRVQAPVSYWDPRYGGDLFFPLEVGFSLLIVVYLAAAAVRRHRRQVHAGPS